MRRRSNEAVAACSRGSDAASERSVATAAENEAPSATVAPSKPWPHVRPLEVTNVFSEFTAPESPKTRTASQREEAGPGGE